MNALYLLFCYFFVFFFESFLGYEISSYAENIPSLKNVDASHSNYANSYVPCIPSATNAINCDGGLLECESQTIESNNGGPVCCTAHESCHSANISTINVNFSNTLIASTAIRCDGYRSCNDAGFLHAENGGNIYCSARGGCRYNDGISTTMEYDIICNGYGGCHRSAISIANNLYCGGYDSCTYTTINNVNNVYAYGFRGTRVSVMNNILNNVYCANNFACYSSTISNVTNNIYGEGYQAMYDSVINKTGGMVMGIGSEVLRNAQITLAATVCGYFNFFFLD